MLVKNVEKKDNNTAIFQVEVDADAFEQAVNKAYKKLKNSIYVAGFRKGKAPRVVIEGMYGADIFHDEAVQDIAPEAFDFAVKEESLETVGTPSIADYNVDDAKVCTITFTTDLYPVVTLGEYKGLEAPYAEPVVTDEEIDSQVEDVRKRNARYIDVERPVQNGDTIVFDFEGFVDGVPFDGGKAENYSLEIGSGMFIPGFEEQLVGMEAEADGEVHVTFPEQYTEELAGKDATFKVKIHSVREPQLPELDDEFAKDVSEFDTLEELKKDLKDKLTHQREHAAEDAFETALLDQLAEGLQAEIPEAMYENRINDSVREFEYRLQSQGLNLQTYLQYTGMDMEAFRKGFRDQAEKQVKVRLALEKIAKLEEIAPTAEEIEAEYAKYAEQYQMDADKVKAILPEKELVKDMAVGKAMDLVKEAAEITAE